MDAKYKARWLNALRSGEYKQTRNRLIRCDSDSEVTFCCLGVLCDIHPDMTRAEEGNALYYTYTRGGAHTTDLPAGLCADLSIPDGERSTLISMNDNGRTFSEIADYIERNL